MSARLPIPLPPLKAPVRVHSYVGKRPGACALSPLHLSPFHTATQLKDALLQHVDASGEPHVPPHVPPHYPASAEALATCIATPYNCDLDEVNAYNGHAAPALVSRSCAYLQYQDGTCSPSIAFNNPGVERERTGNVMWVNITEANMMSIVASLGRGVGALAVRCWYSMASPGNKRKLEVLEERRKVERQERERRRRRVGEGRPSLG